MERLQNPELEERILATMMAYPTKADVAVYILSNLWATAWTGICHDPIAEAIRKALLERMLPDEFLIKQRLASHGDAEAVKRIDAIMPLADAPELLPTRAKMLAEITSLRLAHNDFQYAVNVAQGGDLEAFRKAQDAVKINMSGRSLSGLGLAVGAREACSDCIEALESRIQNPGMTGIPTKFGHLDKALLGLQFGAMTIVAARPSHGKTAFATQLCLQSAADDFPVLYISHEMTRRQIFMRMICNSGKIDTSSAQAGTLNHNTALRYREHALRIANYPITIIDDPSISPYAATDFLRYHASLTKKRGLVIVDYIQLEYIPGYRGQRPDEIAEISKLWRSALKDTDWASLMIAQLNRNSANKEPELKDLRGSGALEQDAHCVMLLYRPGHDDPTKPANKIKISVPKNRDGRLAVQDAHFAGFCQRFDTWHDGIHVEHTTTQQYEFENDHVRREQL